MRLQAGDWTNALLGSASSAAVTVASSLYSVLKSVSTHSKVAQHGDVTKPVTRLRRQDLFNAAWRGDIRQLDVILHRSILDVNTPNEDGLTPIFLAAEAERVDVIRYFHSLQAELNVQSALGRTPLMHAVRSGKHLSAQTLLELGADVSITCPSDGCTALVYAVARSDAEMVQLLLKHGACASVVTRSGETPLTMAVANDCFDVARALVFRLTRHDVNFRLRDGTTPLMLASRSRCERVAFLLLNFGACVNARRDDGDSALLIACAHGSYDVMALLLSAGADVQVRNSCGMTCMQLASLYPQRPALRELLERYGATLNLSLTSRMCDVIKRVYHQHYSHQITARTT